MSGVHYSENSERRTLWPGKMNVCETILDSENMNLATPNVPNKAKSMVGAGCCLTRCREYSTTRSALSGMDLHRGQNTHRNSASKTWQTYWGGERMRGRPASEQFKIISNRTEKQSSHAPVHAHRGQHTTLSPFFPRPSHWLPAYPMPRRVSIHFTSLKSCLVNLPISMYGPLVGNGIVSGCPVTSSSLIFLSFDGASPFKSALKPWPSTL